MTQEKFRDMPFSQRGKMGVGKGKSDHAALNASSGLFFVFEGWLWGYQDVGEEVLL
jgi:hypothetical protein